MTNSSTQSQEKRWQLITAVTTQRERNTAERIRFAIQKTLEFLQLDIGILSKINGDEYTIVHFDAPEDSPLHEGQTFKLGDTYCAITMKADHVISIDHMAESEHNRHPCYEAFQLETYIGTPVFTNGERYGTLNFSSPTPHKTKFEKGDEELVDLLAQWIGSEIERDLGGFREAMLENAGYSIIAASSNGIVQSFNAAAEQMLGYKAEELIGKKHVAEIYDQDELKIHAAELSERAGREISANFATVAKHVLFPDERQEERRTYIAKDGRKIPVEVFVTTVKDSAGITSGYIGIAKDVSKEEEQASELNLRIQAMEANPSPFVIADMQAPDQPLIYINKAFEKQTGYSAEEVIGRNCRFLQGEGTDQKELDILRQALKAGTGCTVTLLNYRKDGSPFWNVLKLSPIHDRNGQLTHFVGVQDDITEIKELEQQARTQQEIFAAILDAVSVPMMISKIDDGKVLYANEHVATLGKLSMDELIGNEMPNFYANPADREAFVAELREKKEVNNYEVLAKNADGETFWILLSSRLTTYDDIPAIATTLIDITDRKAAQEVITTERGRFGETLEAITMPMLITTVEDGIVLYANQHMADLASSTVEKMVGDKTKGFYSDSTAREAFIERLNSSDSVDNFEVELKDINGDPYWALLSSRLTTYQGQSAISTVLIDITDRKAAEIELNRVQADLKRQIEASPEAIGILNTQTKLFENPNNRSVELFGYSYDELIQIGPGHFGPEFQPDGRPSKEVSFANIKKALQGEEPSFERTIITGRGEEIWIEIKLVSLGGDRAHLLRYSTTDITTRKNAEEALRQSQEDLQTQLEASPEAIGILNTQTGLFESPNGNAERLYGLPKEELIKVGPAQMSPEFQPDGRPSAESAMEKIGEALQGGKPVFEWNHINGQGEEFPCEIRLAPLGGDRAHLVRFSVTNISERKRAEADLAKRATELATVFEVSSLVSTIQDPEEMLQTVVDLTKERFDLYHAHIFLLSANKQELVLTRGADKVGRSMVAEGRSIPVVAEGSLVATTAREKIAQVRLYEGEMEGYRPHPDLIDTRTEMAIPLLVGTNLLGILDIRSTESDAFGEAEIQIYSTLAAQIATALQNARSLEDSEKSRNELTMLTQRLTREGWREFAQKSDVVHHYGFNLADEASGLRPQQETDQQNDESNRVIEDLKIQGAKIGELKLVDPAQYNQGMSEVFTAVADRLSAHLENLRLTEQTYTALADADILYQVTTKLNGVRTYYDILNAIAEQMPMAREAKYIGLAYFDTIWTPEKPAERIETLAVWHEDPQRTFNIRNFYIKDYPTYSEYVKPDQPLIVDNLVTDNRLDESFRKVYVEEFQCRSMAIFPLRVAGAWVGYFNLLYTEPQEFNQTEVDRVETVAQQVAISAQTIFLNQQRETALAETEALYKGSEQIVQAQNYLDVLKAVMDSLDILRNSFHHTDIILFDDVWDDAKPPAAMAVVADWMRKGNRVVYSPRKLYTSMYGDNPPFNANGPEYVEDIFNDPRIGQELAQWIHSGLKTNSLITFPLLAAGDFIGVVSAHSYEALPNLNDDDLRLITNMIDQAATVIQSIHLLEIAQKRAQRETQVRQIVDKVRSGSDRNEIMQIARDEIRQLLKANKAQSYLGTQEQLRQRRDKSKNIN